VNIICAETSCWLLLHALNKHTADVFDPTNKMSETFNINEVSKSHPTIIAKTLLYLAVCMQQLPGDFDISRLEMGSIDARMDKYMSTVQSLITSDDELVSTIEGLECLTLQGAYHINGGNPRRAWLTFRRALNVAQLMGIHKRSDTRPGGRQMWYQIVQADRYLVRTFLGSL
jgi:hypothetical protein